MRTSMILLGVLAMVAVVKADFTQTIGVMGMRNGEQLKPIPGCTISMFGRTATTGYGGRAYIEIPENHGDGQIDIYCPGYWYHSEPIAAGGEKPGEGEVWFPVEIVN